MQLAQLNIGRMMYDLDDPRAGDFLNGIDMLNRIAERSPGYVWKFETEFGGVVEGEFDNDPRVLVNLTVWESVASLHHFVWNTLHKHFVSRKEEWFTQLEVAHFVMWWVPDGHEPTLSEAQGKLEHLRRHGDSDAAFGWAYAKTRYDLTGDAA
jgi:hypothetical protein